MTNSTSNQTKQFLITANELSKLLAISERTLWRLVAGGEVLKPLRIGGSTRWKLTQVEQWIENGCPSANDN